jgi:hypothetical protein
VQEEMPRLKEDLVKEALATRSYEWARRIGGHHGQTQMDDLKRVLIYFRSKSHMPGSRPGM